MKYPNKISKYNRMLLDFFLFSFWLIILSLSFVNSIGSVLIVGAFNGKLKTAEFNDTIIEDGRLLSLLLSTLVLKEVDMFSIWPRHML
jgi:hypothetical protein